MKVRICVSVPVDVDPAVVVRGLRDLGAEEVSSRSPGTVGAWMTLKGPGDSGAIYCGMPGCENMAPFGDGRCRVHRPPVVQPPCRICGEPGDCGDDLCAICENDLEREARDRDGEMLPD